MIRNIRTPEGGFTILELIIVLTITVALLVSALAVFNGRIPKAQFETAVNEFSVRVTDAANQVESGYYPFAGNLSCNSAGVLSAGSGEQGTNENCIFIGQALQFGIGDAGCSTSSPDDKCNHTNIYTVHGKRTNGGNVVTNLIDSDPKISDSVALTSYTSGYGLFVDSVWANSTKVGGIAYLQTFGSKASGSDNPSGAPQLQIVPLYTSSVGQTVINFVSQMNASSVGQGLLSAANPKDGIKICLESATTHKYAVVTLGHNGVTTSADKELYGDETIWRAQCS